VGTILRAKANAVRSLSLPTSSADHTCVARGVDARAPPQAPLDSTRPVPRPGEWVVAGVSEPNRVHTPSQPLATQPTPPLLMREAVRGFPDRLRQVCPANCSRPHARTLLDCGMHASCTRANVATYPYTGDGGRQAARCRLRRRRRTSLGAAAIYVDGLPNARCTEWPAHVSAHQGSPADPLCWPHAARGGACPLTHPSASAAPRLSVHRCRP
jgi:hypothetical protein